MAITLSGSTGITSPGGDVSVSQGLSGNLAFTGTGNRILGDFSNATVANRVAFQTSTTNGTTVVHALPNGTSIFSFFETNNASDPTNSAALQIGVDGTTSARISSLIRGTGTYLPMTFFTGGSERVRIDTSGRLLVGTTAANTFDMAIIAGSNATANDFTLFGTSTSQVRLNFSRSGANGRGEVGYDMSTDAMRFVTSGTERMRIGATGFAGLIVTANDGFQVSSSEAAGTTWANFVGRHSGGTTFGGTISFVVWNNGNVVNTNNSYGAFSDIKLKENIVPASPKLDKLMQVEIVNYNLKDQPEQKLIGVVAQQLEQVFPSLIEESPDRDEEGTDLGTVTKSVKYSVFVPMLIKAIQEQQALITQLQADVAALKGTA